MIELKTDIFHPTFISTMDAICFTSNGVIKSNGDLVMGGGVAKTFAEKYPWLPVQMGRMVKLRGNVPCLMLTNPTTLGTLKPAIISFPTKHHYKDPSDLDLIAQSAKKLVGITNDRKFAHVAIPYPGIGLGGLDKKAVKEVISPILDDRFYVLVK